MHKNSIDFMINGKRNLGFNPIWEKPKEEGKKGMKSAYQIGGNPKSGGYDAGDWNTTVATTVLPFGYRRDREKRDEIENECEGGVMGCTVDLRKRK